MSEQPQQEPRQNLNISGDASLKHTQFGPIAGRNAYVSQIQAKVVNVTYDCTHALDKLNITHSPFAVSLPEITVWEGRNQLVENLKTKLLSSNSPKFLVLHGEGGIGKTSLAVKLIESLGVNLKPFRKTQVFPYHELIYFKVNKGTSFDEIIEALTVEESTGNKEDSSSSRKKIEQVIRILSKSKYLILLDDLQLILQTANKQEDDSSFYRPRYAISDDVGRLLNALVYETHYSQVIITSREVPADLSDSRYEYAEPDPMLVHVETLSGVEVEDGVRILQQRILQQRQVKESEEEFLHWISNKVGGNPLLLTHLANIHAEKPGYILKNPKVVTEKEEPILNAQLDISGI